MRNTHFIRSSHRAICEEVINFFGKRTKCIWLGRKNEGWYDCYAQGFRYKQSGTVGVCRKEKFRVFYDYSMLKNVKIKKANFCGYRLIAPIIFAVTFFGIRELFKILVK